MQWRIRQTKDHFEWLADFQTIVGEESLTLTSCFVTNKCPVF